MAIVDTKVKITLIDGVSGNLANVQRGMSDLTRTAAALAASFVTFESAISGIANIVKSGIEFNKTIETASVGMSGVLLSMTKLADRNIEWNEAMGISRDIIKDLNKQAMLTAATPQELVQTFSGLMGIGLGRGLNIEQIKSFTVMGVNAVKSMGLEGRQLIQELRDLLQGSISPQKSTLATALGITTADIKAAQNSADGLFKFLETRMNGFKISANYFPKTFQGASAVLGGAYQMLVAQTVEQPMQRIRDLMQEMFVGLLNEQQSGLNESITKPIEQAGKHLTNLINGATELAGVYKPLFKDLIEYAGDFGAAFTDNIKEITLGFIGWKSVQGMMKSYAYQTLDVYGAINAKINENNAALAKEVQLGKLIAGNRASASTKVDLYGEMMKRKSAMTQQAREFVSNSLDVARKRLTGLLTLDNLKVNDTTLERLKTQLATFQRRLQSLGMSEADTIKTTTQLVENFHKLGGTTSKVQTEITRYIVALQRAKAAKEELLTSKVAIGDSLFAMLKGNVFTNLKLSAEQTEQIIKRVWATYQKSGETAAQSLIKQIELEARLTVEQNKRAELLATIATWYQRISSFTMGFGMIASYAGDKLEDDFISNIGRWATEIGMLATAFQMLWASMNPATALIAVAGTTIIGILTKAKAEAEKAGFSSFSKWYKAQFGTKEEYEAIQKAEKAQRVKNKDKSLDPNTLMPKFNNPNDTETATQKAQDNLVKLLDNAKKLSAEIAAKLAQRSMTNEEQAFANLNKEIATFQAKIDDLKKAGQDITELQNQLDNYTATAMQKLIDKFNTTKIRWDDVIIHIKNSQTNFTDIITAGYDSLASAFTSFGENLITEGGSFMERFNNLLTNFANNVCNTLMKIYLQGLLTKSIMGLFGGGYSTSWLSGSTENASGWLSIGNYVVGHANGGIASGWSLVGEQGPELVNFSNPGRVYTADETRSMIGGGSVNVKVNVINESGTPMNAQQQGQATWDGEGYVINVVMNAIATNRNGMRTLLQGAR